MKRPVFDRNHARVHPISQINIVIGQERAHGIPEQGRMVTRERCNEQHFRIRLNFVFAPTATRAGIALEMQQPAKRLVQREFLADRDRFAANRDFTDAELGFLVTLGDAHEELAAGGNLAAERRVGKRAERVTEQLGVHVRPHLPGGECRVAHFVQGIEQLTTPLQMRCRFIPSFAAERILRRRARRSFAIRDTEELRRATHAVGHREGSRAD